MFKRMVLIVIMIVLALLVVAPVWAQDVPPAEGPGFVEGLVQFISGIVLGTVATLAGVLTLIGRLKNDKATLDAIEWAGKNVPVEVVLAFNELAKRMIDAGMVIDAVTDGLPNTEASSLVRYTVPVETATLKRDTFHG